MFLKDRLQITTERTYTDEGFLRVPARIARTGIQEYYAVEMGLTDREPSDIIRVYRPPEEVFNANSLASFANKPVTDNHPPELVNTDNFNKFNVGHSGPDVTENGMFVETILHINDAKAIRNIESGKVELSNGYTSDIDWTPGVSPDGSNYDCIQRNIKGNHIAIVERGRAGASCKLADNLPTKGVKPPMAKITIDGVDFEVETPAAQAVGKLQSRLSDAEKEVKEKEEELKDKDDEAEEMEKESKKKEDKLNAKLDDAKSKFLDADAVDALVAKRSSLIAKALIVVPGLAWQGKDNATIMKMVVANQYPSLQMDSLSVDYIDSRFDTITESLQVNTNTQLDGALSNHLNKDIDKNKDTRTLDVIARQNFVKYSADAWKGAK